MRHLHSTVKWRDDYGQNQYNIIIVIMIRCWTTLSGESFVFSVEVNNICRRDGRI